MEEAQQRIQECDGIKLDLSNLKLTELPKTLPRSLQRLLCNGNKLTELPDTLPESLQELWCGRNDLTRLPDTLPGSLQVLSCERNWLTELPDNLPGSLQSLDCRDNDLTILPDNLPDNLPGSFCCRKNDLTVGYRSTGYYYDQNVFLFDTKSEYRTYKSIYKGNKTKQIVKIQRFYKTRFYDSQLTIIEPLIQEKSLRTTIMAFL